jgi:hypothetical protein
VGITALSDMKVSQRIRVGLQKTLADYLQEHVDGWDPDRVAWEWSENQAGANQTPIIEIIDTGHVTDYETLRSRDADGNIVSGIVKNDYTFTITVFERGRDSTAILDKVTDWLDAFEAVLRDQTHLTDIPVVVLTQSTDPASTFTIGSDLFGAGQLVVTIESWHEQDQSTFPD